MILLFPSLFDPERAASRRRFCAAWLIFCLPASNVASSRRLDPAPQVANFRIEMIGGGGLGRADQEGLDARIEHKACSAATVAPGPQAGNLRAIATVGNT